MPNQISSMPRIYPTQWFSTIIRRIDNSMDKKVVTDGPGLCMNVLQASPSQIRKSKWETIERNNLQTVFYTNELQLRVNFIIIVEALLNPYQQYLALRFPFILISYCQQGLREIALLGVSMGFPKIPRSCIWLICFLSRCSH